MEDHFYQLKSMHLMKKLNKKNNLQRHFFKDTVITIRLGHMENYCVNQK